MERLTAASSQVEKPATTWVVTLVAVISYYDQ